ncbi:MAG: hypothetical protein EA402_02600 [Planctomycetota bacterium]|nr:MAG: hypothetical protein EA402_02600 [Planctomycetota bacterium]
MYRPAAASAGPCAPRGRITDLNIQSFSPADAGRYLVYRHPSVTATKHRRTSSPAVPAPSGPGFAFIPGIHERRPAVPNSAEGVTTTVANITVDTLIRGPIEVEEDRLISFVAPLLGFEDCQRFLIYQTKPGPLFWLQAVERKEVAFALLMPFAVGLDPDYDISTQDLEELGTTDLGAVSVYTVVTLAADPTQSTTNLRAPILVAGNRGVQMIYDNEALDLRYPLSALLKGG